MKKTLSEQYNKLVDVLSKQEHVRLAYLFGSVAKGKAGKLSDIDIAVLLDESLNKEQRFDLQLELISDISELLKTDKIDMVVINEAPLSLKFEIIKANYPLFVSLLILQVFALL